MLMNITQIGHDLYQLLTKNSGNLYEGEENISRIINANIFSPYL
jgi:hypothetical protein